MKNIDKEPTYYVSLTEYNEVKRMFLKANDEINTLKELLEWCRDELFEIYSNEISHPEDVPIIKKLKEVLK